MINVSRIRWCDLVVLGVSFPADASEVLLQDVTQSLAGGVAPSEAAAGSHTARRARRSITDAPLPDGGGSILVAVVGGSLHLVLDLADTIGITLPTESRFLLFQVPLVGVGRIALALEVTRVVWLIAVLANRGMYDYRSRPVALTMKSQRL